jgi:glutamate carboxypeptidase
MKKLANILFLSSIVFIGYTQPLSKTEQQLLKNIEADYTATMELLKQSVNINSGTFNIEGIKKVGQLYAKELEALGFTIEWITLPDSLKRAGHLVAYRKGKKGKKTFSDRSP